MPQRLFDPDHSIDLRPTTYLVRLWVKPADPEMAWAMDDWVFHDVPDVEDVLTWAQDQQSVTAFEVFARADPNRDWVRLHGVPADGRETVINLSLTAE